MHILRSPRPRTEIIAFALVIAAVLLPRLPALGRFVTADEHLWLTRSANFYYALSHGDWAGTYQMGHPGVTVMWAGAAGFWAVYPEYRQDDQGLLDPTQFHQYIQRKSEFVSPLELLRAGRYILLAGHTLVLALAYLYARRLLGILPALAGFPLLAFDPFHIALSRVLHLDGLYGSLALLSLLAYLGFLQNRRLRHLLVSAAAGGLAVLTKSPGLFVAPVVALVAALDLWTGLRSAAGSPPKAVLSRQSLPLIWGAAWPWLAWFGLAAVVLVIAWPAMWVDPLGTLGKVFGLAQQFTESGHESALFFNGAVIRDGNFGPALFYFYPLTYLWRATPLVMLGLGLALPLAWLRRSLFDDPQTCRTALGLLLLAMVFAFGLSFPEKKFDRYLIPVYPPLDLLAGLGLVGFNSIFKTMWGNSTSPHHCEEGASPTKQSEPPNRLEPAVASGTQSSSARPLLRRFLTAFLLLAALGLQAASALSTYPYYFTYYNPLLGGSRKAPQAMQVGWGEGLDQAARYLNQKPGARDLQVITLYATGCFSYYFNGQTRSFSYESEASPEEWQRFEAADYALVYISHRQHQLSRGILERLESMQPEHTIWLEGMEYVRIYRLK